MYEDAAELGWQGDEAADRADRAAGGGGDLNLGDAIADFAVKSETAVEAATRAARAQMLVDDDAERNFQLKLTFMATRLQAVAEAVAAHLRVTALLACRW